MKVLLRGLLCFVFVGITIAGRASPCLSQALIANNSIRLLAIVRAIDQLPFCFFITMSVAPCVLLCC